MKRKMLCMALATAVFAGPAFAVEPLRSSPYDYRIKSAIYNPQDTVVIDAVIGLATHITVSPGERYVTHVFGDSEAWSFAHVENNFFIKPKEAHGDTNLTIVTDKRTYHILLRYIGDYKSGAKGKQETRFIQTPWTMRQATLELTYTYPMEDARRAVAAREQAKVQTALAAPEFAPGPRNFSYQMSDDPKAQPIAPVNVWDDYRFTYFKFPANAELPTIFVIGADGKESTVNVRTIGRERNIVQAQMVAREWRIRYGKKMVIGLINSGFDPSRGANTTGTAAPNVERVEKTETNDGGTL
ncbi:TrbG/VirB9 family P-type conjugative transfer protein [Rhizobium sp. VS19-DR104.2]|uniref:TrbG/VirB9 family P-type conjugative transfer protein n=1 Tax=Rhizobium/Agrobacterium group TaxID=227290 RepID=UPI001CC76A27|nr:MULTISPECIES: TrbG/VirB9 family P-type conjugative transfer protein [unclassified Rhizobium]MBZ5763340.1 TrbG/VirB9 family P-type conjugative transfer protein [Rhizobium sp. VS19-DR96]MBZ5769235.1 TrbG/VirB9 family P-type conjugative transfer protein [Rhizobium sp. VS19-DR129.2]MBZ5776770.1 TrbG/VirB9 family P-type conjugative transfer protein [Rhizobium sp. VS19-DRK62.2]MBZ5786642.1 TrbG/VirB9 family P-type conjugative transfer protein [Rhizobium sp. VS19-DR121]MBZ5805293.1 TrbG/VirB9 fami